MSDVKSWTKEDLLDLDKLREMCQRYAVAKMENSRMDDIAKKIAFDFEPVAKSIGEHLYERGGRKEMERFLIELGNMDGRRELETLWGPLGLTYVPKKRAHWIKY